MSAQQVPRVLDLGIVHELHFAQIRDAIVVRHHVGLSDGQRRERAIWEHGMPAGERAGQSGWIGRVREWHQRFLAGQDGLERGLILLLGLGLVLRHLGNHPLAK